MQLLLHVKHDLSIINPESDQSIPTLEPPRSFLNSSQAFPIRNSIFPLNPNHVKFFFFVFSPVAPRLGEVFDVPPTHSPGLALVSISSGDSD